MSAPDTPVTSPGRVPGLAGRAPRLNILMVASEMSPWAKTGGLADVVAALPEALDALGHDVTIVLPRYRGVESSAAVVETSLVLADRRYDVAFHTHEVTRRRRVVLVDVPALFDRDGLYGTGGEDYADNAERYGVLATAALAWSDLDDTGRPFDIIHAHDWQSGLVPVLLGTDRHRHARAAGAGVVFTIHNLAYQGLFDSDVVAQLGLPWEAFTMDTGEFWGQFSFLKAGLVYSDAITTVSPTYAQETLRPEWGCGMEGVLSAHADRYVGILNGIDSRVWNPATDPHLPRTFDAADMTGKAVCKRALLQRFGLPVGDDALARPVVGMVSRLVAQKGLETIEAASAALVLLDATWVFVGQGEPAFERFVVDLAQRHPTRVAAFIGFDEPLAHLVEAGSDLFLMPSRFEPCGLNQMYSLRYGTVPVVRAVGGLDDTIQPYTTRARRANGFKFREDTAGALVRTMKQAVRLFRDKAAWSRLMLEGMSQDHSWETSAREYVKVYRRARQAAAMRAAR